MKRVMSILLISIISLTSCITYKRVDINIIKQQPHRKIENYNGSLQSPIMERIKTATPVIIDYLNRMDSTDKYSTYEPSNDEKELFIEYYNLLPTKFQKTIESKVINIFFLRNFIGGGMSDYLFDESGHLFIALYINSDVLHTSLSDWIKYRDNSTYINDDSKTQINVDCGNKYYGLLHTLFHESSHIYDYINHITPFVEPNLINVDTKTEFVTSFIKGIWKDYGHPYSQYDFQNRTNVSGYGLGKKLNQEFSIELYRNINNTPFSSIYGSSTWAEDFAETFTWFYLKKYLGIDYITTIYRDNEIIGTYSPDINPLVYNRYDQFKTLLE
jgi:hypothetical protein